jgi:hypothetical protein
MVDKSPPTSTNALAEATKRFVVISAPLRGLLNSAA